MARSSKDLLLSNQVCFAVYSTAHALNRFYKPLLDRLGLTYPQYLVMLVLWERDDRTVKEIGAALDLDSGTLTPLLKRLESAKLVKRERDAADERQVRIGLTRKGASLRDEALPIPSELGAAAGRERDELLALRAELAELRDRLKKATKG